MVLQKVSGVGIKQAVEEFGSLQKANNSLKTREEALQTNLLALARDIDSKEKVRAKYRDDLSRLEKTIEERKRELDELEKALRKFKQDADEFIDSQERFIFQYYTFESLVAMLRTSPSSKENIKELASEILIMGEAVWKLPDEPHKLRWLFVHTVLGEHLYCYRCINCGLKFIANQEVKSHMLGYYCPNCGFLSHMAADNSFLEAMLNSSDPPDTNEAKDKEG